MKTDNIEKEIREEWFKDHVAKLEKLSDDVVILTWREPGTSSYAVRYVFDYNKIYITGDIGDAIVQVYDKVDLEKVSKFELDYFHKKLVARNEEKWAFSEDEAINRLDEEIQEIKERMQDELYATDETIKIILESNCINLNGYRPKECDIDREFCARCETYRGYIATMKKLKESAKICNSRGNWVAQIYIDHMEELEDYDNEWYESIFDVGNEYPRNVQAFLIGLKMAWEQLGNA